MLACMESRQGKWSKAISKEGSTTARQNIFHVYDVMATAEETGRLIVRIGNGAHRGSVGRRRRLLLGSQEHRADVAC